MERRVREDGDECIGDLLSQHFSHHRANNYGKVSNIDKRISKKEIHNPYTKKKERNCKICKKELAEGHYCQGCAYKKGICKMCGKKVVNTSTEYRSTNA